MRFEPRLTPAAIGRATLAWVGLLVSLVGLPSCERGSGSSVRAQGRTAPSQSSASRSSCSAITDCDSYLSCIDRTCQKPPGVTGQSDQSTPVATFVDADGQQVHSFYLELAQTPAEREQGLMFRRDMHDNWGMLFIYPAEKPRSFWMKNTLIPLDMVFVDGSGRIISMVRRAEPLSRAPHSSRGYARFILELKGGRAEAAGLEVGDVMQLDNVAEEHQPHNY